MASRWWWQVELSVLHSLSPLLKVGQARSGGAVGFLLAHAGPPHLDQHRVERLDAPTLRPARAKRERQRADNLVDLNFGTRALRELKKSQVQRCLPGRHGNRRAVPLPRRGRYVAEERLRGGGVLRGGGGHAEGCHRRHRHPSDRRHTGRVVPGAAGAGAPVWTCST